MKKSPIILSILLLCLATLTAFGQAKGDMSDWNVPPPLPAGTIPKTPGEKGKTPLLLPADVPVPSLNSTPGAKAVSLPPVDQTAPEVEAPGQPEFPAMPFATPDIPLPAVPQAMELPKQTLHEQEAESTPTMPEPQAPEMPQFPPQPEINKGMETGGDLKIPVMPAILAQPVKIALPSNAFPFTEWPAPPIPENTDMSLSTTNEKNNNQDKTEVKKKPVKHRRGG